MKMNNDAPISKLPLSHSMHKTYSDCYRMQGFVGGDWGYAMNTNVVGGERDVSPGCRGSRLEPKDRKLAIYFLGWESSELHEDASKTPIFAEEMAKLGPWMSQESGACEGPLPGLITMQPINVSGQRKRVSKGQSSTGCITCRGHKVKCDETKPTCIRCQTARFKCEGYASNFRIVTSASLVPSALPPLLEDVLYLAQHFTIRPVPTHSSTYEKEARLTLAASSEPAIKHALASLNTLRRVHAKRGSSSAAGQMTSSLQRGIQEYTNSLGALATRLADNEVATGKAALLCCQMFISIETALNNFTQFHLSNPNEMPNVDLFIIKMFLTCPDRLFTFPPESLDEIEIEWKAVDNMGRPNLCQSMLHARQQLASISMAVISLLEQTRRQTLAESMVGVQAEQSQLMESLGRWRSLFTPVLSLTTEYTPLNARLAALFTMLFYCILRFSLNMAFQHLSLDTEALKAELDEMTWVASLLTQLKPI
ncbi:Zn(2)-C6 fungal-type DNA-binding domain-containing protein [Fusarium mundagurra]|uniref:Zn(2)-C6 fungal-type DNA-binding domain-containing protein n=1 Tax=Fusarium mundagurra TaxID=1567541 RepID=A0A8H5YZ12_9HYPO|nr:Zn(2)-C6 fungal-type DNA-binding domain-containing protein [Fusarium mundagurra]